ncbi:dTDP-4-dehydrorhamnose reductase family protein [Variovorax terrae]|uniref:dTDP-4-dehydrorhamnose reductase n=1 Tax=Variovorax terrae TaxID=2923278 RepID=A0A9X2ARK0_9BURK|nr:SDR family oxidoreductase [Variovorax terrae]MCJ0764271.1 SDR family oxidoreductase [Variovorax terrae]
MKILVLGASGMLGASLVPHLTACGHQVASHGRRGEWAADLGNAGETLMLLRRVSPEAVINLVGLTDVDRCESHPKEAWLTNVLTAENAATASAAVGAHLIQISTDQVYDQAPSNNESQACPGNHYAMSKYAGELAALGAGATVLRSNFFGLSRHPTRRSLTDWLFNALTKGQPLQVFDDVRFSPLSMATLCEMIEAVALRRQHGIFNLGSCGGMSKADFAFTFAGTLGLATTTMSRGLAANATFLKAWRPKAMCMDSHRFEQVFGQTLPDLEAEIERAAKDYRELH